MHTIVSADGTLIAFDQIGTGPPLVLIAGASCDRGADKSIAEALTGKFTVLNYDRRGRGDSSDSPPYSVEREIEDIDALLDAAGGSATVLGLSSGAVLAADAAAAGLTIDRLVLWEPPFAVDDDGRRRSLEYATELKELLGADRRSDALTLFMSYVGMPNEAIVGVRQSPYWQAGLSLAPTLAYDAAIMADGALERHHLGAIGSPTLVLTGSRSPASLRKAAEATAAEIPAAEFDVLDDQDHNVSGDALAAAIRRFVAR